MKKIIRAVQTGKNKWVKKTGWRMSKEDKVITFLLVFCLGYLTVRTIIG